MSNGFFSLRFMACSTYQPPAPSVPVERAQDLVAKGTGKIYVETEDLLTVKGVDSMYSMNIS